MVVSVDGFINFKKILSNPHSAHSDINYLQI
jgi:hypothetical protein